MAKVIGFYIPINFRKKAEPAPAEHCGKVIEFESWKRKSA
jgi:hypothetical protein